VSNSTQTPNQVIYRETVWPSFAAVSPLIIVAPSFALVVTPFTDFVVATLVGSVMFVITLLVVLSIAPKIAVVSEGRGAFLQVNAARIGTNHISSVEIIAKSDVRQERGPKLDARSFRVFQPSVAAMVKIHLKDPADSTPYWLVSTRDPEAIKAALKK